MKFNFLIKISLFLVVMVLFTNCSKEEIIPEDIEINDFVWGGMNAYYKWQGNVEDLADTKFSTRDQLNEYLAGFESPTDLFSTLLVNSDDDSLITNDYTVLEDALDGYITTNGLEVSLAEFADGSGHYAYAFDVLEGSTADLVGIEPGMFFTHVNGDTITETNFDAYFDLETIALSEADSNSGNPVANGNTFNIFPDEIQEPAFTNQQIINSTIGYFALHHFGPSYVDDLNSLFNTFSTNAIDDLIIDLRLNEGRGDVETATFLASMITGQFDGEVFSRQIWNNKVMSNLNNANLATYFTDVIEINANTEQRIASLGLETVYFIISNETDAASLALINGLASYIDVVLVGYENTLTGSDLLFSTILYDSDDYTKNGENFNTNHTWAIQPIVYEVTDKDGVNIGSLSPTIEVTGTATNVSTLGDVNEPLLAAAIEQIETTP